MKLVTLLSCLLCFVSCDLPVPSFGSGDDKVIIKEIKSPLMKIEWFTYSAAFGEFPNFVTVITRDKVDTICISTNIADVASLGNDSIKLAFYGYPKKYDQKIELPLKVQSFIIVSDTTYVYKERKQVE